MTDVWLALGAAVLIAVGAGVILARGLSSKPRPSSKPHPRSTAPTPERMRTETAPPAVRPTERVETDNSVAWLLVALPLLSPVVLAGLYLSKINASSDAVLWVTIGVTVALAALDERLLEKRGVKVHGTWAAILVPFYLIDRARWTAQTFALPAAWLLTAVLGFTAGVAVDKALGPVTLEMSALESYLAEQMDGSPSVECPSQDTYWVDDTFTCTAAAADGVETHIAVTVADHDGRFTYVDAG